VKQFEEQRSFHKQIRIDSLNGLRPIRNNVLLKRIYNNLEETTPAGLYKAAPSMNKNEYLYQNSDRVFEVVRTPKELHIHPTIPNCPLWVCDMELEIGDLVWVWGRAPLYSPQLVVGEETYDFISYFECILALRRSTERHLASLRKYVERDEIIYEVIPLNGYVIMEEVHEEKIALSYKKKVVKEEFGKVAYVGKPNKRYWQFDKVNNKFYTIDRETDVDIKAGDKVVIGSIRGEIAHPKIEDDLFQYFNGKTYFALQRQYIDAVIKN
jgi:co-chaperonin GroES (HSP10)